MSLPNFTRRRFTALLTFAAPALRLHGGEREMPALDAAMTDFMAKRRVPGGALAVVKDKRLVFAKGYGQVDRGSTTAVKAEALFRIASISKPFTAVAVMQLVEAGKLSLDAKAFALLKLEPVFEKDAKADPRLADITVRQLLQHTAGWDREASFDPMFRPGEIASVTGTPAPAGPEAIIRYMLGRNLDFDPGSRYAYSSFGYCVLGRIIEKLTGRSYEAHVKKAVLTACGIRRMRLGYTLDGQQAPGEVRYCMDTDELDDSVFPDKPGKVPSPYGGFNMEAMDAHGAWIASAVDLVRFAAALHDPAACPLLKAETHAAMLAPPPPPLDAAAKKYYGCGWGVRLHEKGGASFNHSGSLPGTATMLMHRHDGVSWAALFNQRSSTDADIDEELTKAIEAMPSWPEHDLFTGYGGD